MPIYNERTFIGIQSGFFLSIDLIDMKKFDYRSVLSKLRYDDKGNLILDQFKKKNLIKNEIGRILVVS